MIHTTKCKDCKRPIFIVKGKTWHKEYNGAKCPRMYKTLRVSHAIMTDAKNGAYHELV